MQMVQAVRDGQSMRAAARQFSVSVSTVKLWVDRAAGQRVDRVDFSDRKAGALRPHNRSSAQMERRVLVFASVCASTSPGRSTARRPLRG